MKTENKKTETAAAPKTIDMTPTWREQLNIALVLLEGGAPAGRKMARVELVKMARLADLYVKSQAEIKDLVALNKILVIHNNEPEETLRNAVRTCTDLFSCDLELEAEVRALYSDDFLTAALTK